MKEEIRKFNKEFNECDMGYILIGPGRWGTRDKSLGVPVDWAEINRAAVIIETGLKDFDIEPSQGSHFFHNLVALNRGYLSIPYHHNSKSFINWDYLKSMDVINIGEF